MSISVTEFIQSAYSANGVQIIVGVNGSGKSRLLVDLARKYAALKRPVYAVCNTPYDRFIGIRNIMRVSSATGRTLPLKLMKAAIADFDTLRSSLNVITETLKYCGYDPGFDVQITQGPLAQFLNSNLLRYEDQDTLQVQEIVMDYFESIGKQAPKLRSAELERLPYLLSRVRFGRDLLLGHFDAGGSSLSLSENRDLANLVGGEKLLRKVHAIRDLKITLFKNGRPINLLEASSGELTLISTFVFLATTIPSSAVLLIDEPENSLHPQWQREYIEKLRDVVSLRSPTIILATHSPIIVIGAKADAKDVQVFQLSGGLLDSVPMIGSSNSVEQTLWDAFETVTPKNHYISEQLANKLEELSNKQITLVQFGEYISELKQSSFNDKQKQFFDATLELASSVSEKSESN